MSQQASHPPALRPLSQNDQAAHGELVNNMIDFTGADGYTALQLVSNAMNTGSFSRQPCAGVSIPGCQPETG